MTNSADPDQLTLFAKPGISEFSSTRVNIRGEAPEKLPATEIGEAMEIGERYICVNIVVSPVVSVAVAYWLC